MLMHNPFGTGSHGSQYCMQFSFHTMQKLTQLAVLYIYALWWVKAYEEDPRKYPLPPPLSDLTAYSPCSYNSHVTMPPLAEHVATSVLALWESHWQLLLDLMLSSSTLNKMRGKILSSTRHPLVSLLIRRPMFDLGDGLGMMV